MVRDSLDPIEAELDELLCRWHAWSQADSVGSGYNRRALVCGDYRISRQYDDANGQLDADLDKRQCHAVEFAVRQMADPWRCAIYCIARALYSGASVWGHSRLPADAAERARITTEARAELTRRLQSAGVM